MAPLYPKRPRRARRVRPYARHAGDLRVLGLAVAQCLLARGVVR